MGTGIPVDATSMVAHYKQQSFQLSFSNLNLQTQQSQSLAADSNANAEEDASNIFLSDGAKSALADAKFAVDLAKAQNQQDIAERTGRGLSEFVHGLQALLGGGGGRPDEDSLMHGIGQKVSERARQMGQGLLEQAGRTDFSFEQVNVQVSMESFDLRVQTDEGETSLKIERISLSISVTEISGSFSTRESLAFADQPAGQEEEADDETAAQTDAIEQLLQRFQGIDAVERPGPANLLRLFTDLPLLDADATDKFFEETDRTNLTA